MSVFFFFFFSSRRRHTRFSRDWSSDVCSSDLGCRPTGCSTPPVRASSPCSSCRTGSTRRSEERRVGKECRSRWSADHEKKKEGQMGVEGGVSLNEAAGRDRRGGFV